MVSILKIEFKLKLIEKTIHEFKIKSLIKKVVGLN